VKQWETFDWEANAYGEPSLGPQAFDSVCQIKAESCQTLEQPAAVHVVSPTYQSDCFLTSASRTGRHADMNFNFVARTLIAQAGDQESSTWRVFYCVLRAPRAIGTLPDIHSHSRRYEWRLIRRWDTSLSDKEMETQKSSNRSFSGKKLERRKMREQRETRFFCGFNLVRLQLCNVGCRKRRRRRARLSPAPRVLVKTQPNGRRAFATSSYRPLDALKSLGHWHRS